MKLQIFIVGEKERKRSAGIFMVDVLVKKECVVPELDFLLDLPRRGNPGKGEMTI